LAMELAGDPPTLNLRLDAAEPTGVLLDRVLGRTDRPPLALSLSGTGPVADWHGRLGIEAGALARLDADLTLASAADTVLGLSGTAAVSRLLPPELAVPIGDQVGFSLRATFGDRMVVDPFSLRVAAGSVTGDLALGAT